MRFDDRPCRICGGRVHQESVDVGVGVIYGPSWCEDCGDDPDETAEREPEISLAELESDYWGPL